MELADEPSIEDRIGAIAARLDQAHEAIARGERVDLTGLDRETNLLCVRLAQAVPHSRKHLPKLEGVLDRLNGIEADLKQQFEAV